MATRIAIFGARGDQGEAQLRRALAAGQDPIAVTREPDALRRTFGSALDIRSADYRDPNSLRRALHSANAAFLTLPSTSFQAADIVIAAAEAVGAACRAMSVEMLVFNSSMIIKSSPRGFAAHDARFEIRSRLFACGVPVVSIQPVIYQDNLLRAWARPAIAEGVLRYPHRIDQDVSWITQDDTADLMIAALARPHLAGQGFNVGGPEPIRGPDLARRLSAVLGRDMRFESQPIAEFCARMAAVFKESSTVSREHLVGELQRIYEWYCHSPERPFCVDMDPIIKLFDVHLTRFEDWAVRQNWPPPVP